MNHNTHTYLSVNLAHNSPFLATPDALSAMYPSMKYEGQVGELADVHLFSVPKEDWANVENHVLNGLESTHGVLHVQVQTPRQRVKRGEEEL